MRVYVCEDYFENILTGVYEAWEYALSHGHEQVRLELQKEDTFCLFTEYIEVRTNQEKAEKVIRSVKRKLSEEVFAHIYQAALSYREEKADRIYRFLIEAMKRGNKILKEYANPAVMPLYELVRNVGNESHHLLGFIRFEELQGKILFAKITPKNRVLTIVAPHFADRLNTENWMIYDSVHEEAAIHEKGKDWYLMGVKEGDFNTFAAEKTEEEIQHLWRTFFETVAIESRVNEKLQKQMLPLRFRQNIVEFNKSNKI